MYNKKGFSLTSTILTILLITTLLGGGYYYFNNTDEEIFDLDNNPTNCQTPTGHNSCIDNSGIDEQLVGTWRLQSQTITKDSSMTSPFSGKTLTFKHDGTYIEDYSTESAETQQINTPSISISSECKPSGMTTGRYESFHTYNPSNPNSPTELRITRTGGEKPKITCKTNTGGETTSKVPSTIPLGTGQAESGGLNGQYVKYMYTMNESWTTLTLTQENTITGVTLTYVFTR